MPYREEQYTEEIPHRVTMEGRSSLSISGVEEVGSFDENTIELETAKGMLIVRGADLHIEKLSLDGGDLNVRGSIDSLTYEDLRPTSGGLLSRLFR